MSKNGILDFNPSQNSKQATPDRYTLHSVSFPDGAKCNIDEIDTKQTPLPAGIFEFLLKHYIVLHDSSFVYVFNYKNKRYEKYSENNFVFFIKYILKSGTKHLVAKKDCLGVYSLVLSDPELYRDFALWRKDHPEIIAVENGLYNAKTQTLCPATPDDYVNIIYRFSYKPNSTLSQAPYFKKFLETSLLYNDDPSSGELMMEIIGYTLSSSTRLRKIFLFYGATASGKSVILNLLAKILGQENVSNVALHALGERFNVSDLCNKQANLSTEVSGKDLHNLEIIKALSASENIRIEEKFKQGFSKEITTHLLFATNVLPSISTSEAACGNNEAFFNRLCFTVFPRTIPAEEAIVDLDDKLLGEKDFIFSICLDKYSSLFKRNFILTRCKASEDILKQYQTEENCIEDFVKNCTRYEEGYKTSMSDMLNAFAKYCKINGFNHKPGNKELRTYFEVSYKPEVVYKRVCPSKGGSPLWCFVGIKIIGNKEEE